MSLLRPWQDLQRVTQEWRLSVATPPVAPVATVAELQRQARILFPGEADPFSGAEDDDLDRMIAAATQLIDSPEGWLGRSLITRTLRLSLDRSPPRIVRLPSPPVASITQVAYTDPDGVDVVVLSGDLATEGYRFDRSDTGQAALIWNDDWPDTEDRPARIRIDYVAGYGLASDDIPDVAKHYILMRAAELYRDREASVVGTIHTKLEHVERALDGFRVRTP